MSHFPKKCESVFLDPVLRSSATEVEHVNLAQRMFVLLDACSDVIASIAATSFARSLVTKKEAQGFQRLITETCSANVNTAES